MSRFTSRPLRVYLPQLLASRALPCDDGGAGQAGAQRLHAAGLRGEQGEERLQRRRPRRGARQPHEAPRERSQGRHTPSHFSCPRTRTPRARAQELSPRCAAACHRVRGISSRSSRVYWVTPSSGCVRAASLPPLHIVAHPGRSGVSRLPALQRCCAPPDHLASPPMLRGTRVCIGGSVRRVPVALWRWGG
eukprot:scaffold98608_cov54-Phaeocystis_antarctica.AAC.2